MYGFYTDSGYIGFINDEPMLFATEREYYEYLNEKEND